MSTIDVPYLVEQERQAAHAPPRPPPDYIKTQPTGPETAANHYYHIYNEKRRLSFLDNKRRFCMIVSVLVALVIAGAALLGIALTRGLGRRSESAVGLAATVSSEGTAASTVVLTVTRSLTLSESTSSSSMVEASSSVSIASTSTLVVTITTTLPLPMFSSPSAAEPSAVSTASTSSAKTSTTPTVPVSSETITASSTGQTSSSDKEGVGALLSSFLARLSTSPSSTSTASETSSASEPVHTDSKLGAAYLSSREENRQVVIWQDGDGHLVASETWEEGTSRYRISDRMVKGAEKAKHGTSLAVVSDPAGAVHVFYLSRRNVVTHIFEQSRGDWATGSVGVDYQPVVAHPESRLSTTWHQRRSMASVLVLLYQSPSRELHVLLSDQPATDRTWYKVDIALQLGHPQIGRWDGLGHAVSNGWRYPRDDTEAEYHGIVGATEGDGVVLPWECSVDFRSPPARDVKCYWLNGTFHDARERSIALISPSTQFAWLGVTDPDVDSYGLAYEFSFLSLDRDGTIHDSRLGVGLPRKLGTDFGSLSRQGQLRADAMAGTEEGRLFVRSGRVVMEYGMRNGDWAFEGRVNTTLTEAADRQSSNIGSAVE